MVHAGNVSVLICGCLARVETLRGFVATGRLNKLVIVFQMLLVLAYQSLCDNDGVLSSSAVVC